VNALIDRVTRTAVRKGIRQGLLAGDGKWIAIGALAWLVRFLRRTRDPQTIVEQLRVGESIIVSNLGPRPNRRSRRKESPISTTALLTALAAARESGRYKEASASEPVSVAVSDRRSRRGRRTG
jgi:hypothetical protein